jgi:hypothetical protein
MTEYDVEAGIPMPKARRGGGRKSKYPFDAMGVGDSFALPEKNLKQCQQLATVRNKKNGEKFAAREVEGVVRIFRVE